MMIVSDLRSGHIPAVAGLPDPPIEGGGSFKLCNTALQGEGSSSIDDVYFPDGDGGDLNHDCEYTDNGEAPSNFATLLYKVDIMT